MCPDDGRSRIGAACSSFASKVRQAISLAAKRRLPWLLPLMRVLQRRRREKGWANPQAGSLPTEHGITAALQPHMRRISVKSIGSCRACCLRAWSVHECHERREEAAVQGLIRAPLAHPSSPRRHPASVSAGRRTCLTSDSNNCRTSSRGVPPRVGAVLQQRRLRGWKSLQSQRCRSHCQRARSSLSRASRRRLLVGELAERTVYRQSRSASRSSGTARAFRRDPVQRSPRPR